MERLVLLWEKSGVIFASAGWLRRAGRCLSVLALGLVVTSAHAGAPLSRFYGEYIGHVAAEEDGKELVRDLSVEIRPGRKSGDFRVRWTTVTHKADGRMKRKVYHIQFTPSERPAIYSSAMKTNVFGGKEALDPLQGDPFVWARVKGTTLSVHALMILDDGGYEMQVYDRTLNDQGLYLHFSRNRNGVPQRDIEAQLVRVAD